MMGYDRKLSLMNTVSIIFLKVFYFLLDQKVTKTQGSRIRAIISYALRYISIAGLRHRASTNSLKYIKLYTVGASQSRLMRGSTANTRQIMAGKRPC